MNELTHISLFSGIGGFDLAAEWAGFRTIAMCEIDPFCQEVLSARFGAVLANSEGKARFGAVADAAHGDGASRGMRPEIIVAERGHRETVGARHGNQNSGAPLIIPDIRDFDGTRFRGATLLTGGFPCQPFSCAGKRGGKDDDRHLWPEMLRVISESRPHWVLAENVSGIIGMELDQVLADLEMEGYAARTFHIGAVGVNAPHRRMRVWIVANSERGGFNGEEIHLPQRGPRQTVPMPTGADSDAPDAGHEGLQGGMREQSLRHAGQLGRDGGDQERGWEENWLEVATRFCRVDDGLPPWIHSRRVARLKALGNAIVPACVFPILQAIAQIEREKE